MSLPWLALATELAACQFPLTVVHKLFSLMLSLISCVVMRVLDGIITFHRLCGKVWMILDCVNNDDNCCFAVYPSDRTLVKSKRSEVHTSFCRVVLMSF